MAHRLNTIALRLLALAAAAAPIAAFGAGLAVPARAASAQFNDEDPVATNLKRQTLMRLMRRVTVDLQDHRLEDVVQFIADVTQADITPLWIDDRNSVGLDPEAMITLNARDITALQLLEMVLDKLAVDRFSGGSTWQFTKYGAFEFGPKERLNRRRQVEIYDINDMLMDVPDYDNAPEFDLNTVFQMGGQQGGGGGGGGQSPFQDRGTDIERRSREDKIQDVIDLLITTVEPEQWLDNGGEAATVRELRGSLFINAPDYIHRQINGYPWWPARAQSVRYSEGRRYVTLDGSYDFAEAGLETTIEIEAVP